MKISNMKYRYCSNLDFVQTTVDRIANVLDVSECPWK